MSDFITNGELRIEAERLCDENERLKAENAKLREMASKLYQQVLQDDAAWRDVRAWEAAHKFEKCMRELGIEVD